MLRWICWLVLASLATSQPVIDECPLPWIPNNGSCYDFVETYDLTYQEASIYCLQNYATLLSIGSVGEHTFIKNWLNDHDRDRHDWFTSGYKDRNSQFIWESDGSDISLDFFVNQTEKTRLVIDPVSRMECTQIVYRYESGSVNEFHWAWSRLMKPGPFICEINKQDIWKIYQQKRDFSYGSGIKDPNLWEMGPNITAQSKPTVFFKSSDKMTNVILDCQATGNPRPDYKWFRKSPQQSNIEWITSSLGSRYQITNGRLIIVNPDPEKDASIYTCVASNQMGTVYSNPIEISHGYLEQFSNIPPSPIVATMYTGKDITCQDINHNTDLTYQWFKNNVFNFIRTELNPQYFISKNGHLYISEVQAADHDMYYCAVSMAPKLGQILASNQPPSRNSMGVQLNIAGENANTYGPDIQDKFPQFFPSVPMVGDKVEIECLAYGRLPLYYSWVRIDAPLHPAAYLRDHNRVLIIPKARLEDTGSYKCVVNGKRNSASKTLFLNLQAPPSFPYPLQNQHVDVDSKVTWTCNAIGFPRVTYTWYKNGNILRSNTTDGVTINRNILLINKAEAARHNGMYQCEANNVHDLARSSAQLRVLSIKPTFANYPVLSSRQAAEGGSITIPCRPEAAPRAMITWTKNGVGVGTVLLTGDLQLSDLSKADAGTYTCVAENILGTASSSFNLTVESKAVFSELPYDAYVDQNQTTHLLCKASFDKSKTDIVYSWMFNSHVIDFKGGSFEDANHYDMPLAQSGNSGLLYIKNAQFRHQGVYTCLVTTVTGDISTKAFVTVKGPPEEPVGIHARVNPSTDIPFGDVQLWWLGQKQLQHFYLVHKYAIEYQTRFDEDAGHIWRTLKSDIPETEVIVDHLPDWRRFVIREGLSPGTDYRFRLRAGNNQVGYGPASRIPSIWYKMISAPPIVAPDYVGGGGGSVGELNIKWEPLPRPLWGGTTMKYILHYRQKNDRNTDGVWQTVENLVSTSFSKTVSRELYYTPYEVKVQAQNEMGKGPNSSVVVVYSAEDMPANIAPKFVDAIAINATAGIVQWEPIPNNRETARGTVLAYQVNYWLEGDTRCLGKYEDTARFIRFYGNVDRGLIVGMEFSEDYCVNLQFLNHAGLGPKTDNYYIGMYFAPPSKYPEYVSVTSHGRESVRVTWRGVSTEWGEEPLIGYKAWWWDAREDIRTARITDFNRTATGVIHGVERNVVYKLRILGYSLGGDGKKSQVVYFTLGGQVELDPATTDLMNGAPSQQHVPLVVAFFSFVISLLILVSQ